MKHEQESLRSFRIRVGHYEVIVQAHNADEALEPARRQMARELPRLYDVIRNLAINRFQVEAT
jgi:hypothetical protein